MELSFSNCSGYEKFRSLMGGLVDRKSEYRGFIVVRNSYSRAWRKASILKSVTIREDLSKVLILTEEFAVDLAVVCTWESQPCLVGDR